MHHLIYTVNLSDGPHFTKVGPFAILNITEVILMGYQEDFITQISAHICAWRNYLGWGVASAIIAQACLESAYGRSDKARNYNNFFGLKYKSKAEIAGGIILIGMGIKILLEHLGVF